jgi:hypothetical protein
MRRPASAARAGADGLVPGELAALLYELLDAHSDTAELAAELVHEGDLRWRAHLDYLRALQRAGREALAHTSFEEAA